jgi:hypothetical protein
MHAIKINMRAQGTLKQLGSSGLRAWICGRSLAGIAGSNLPWHGCLSVVSVVCCQVERSLRRADHSSKGVLPTVVGLSVILKPR